MANTSANKTKSYIAFLLACLLLATTFIPTVSVAAEETLYSMSEDFEYGGIFSHATQVTEVTDGSGVYTRTSKDGNATIYMKHDASWNEATQTGLTTGKIVDQYNANPPYGRAAYLPLSTANGGGYLEYDFNKLLTGQVTISFQAVGGMGTGVAPSWEVLDDNGNVVIKGGNGDAPCLGADATFECAYCTSGIHAAGAHKTASGATITSDNISTGAVFGSYRGWYKLKLNFDEGTATFEERGRVRESGVATDNWRPFRGYDADVAVPETSPEYVMALSSTRGARKIRFNFSGPYAPQDHWNPAIVAKPFGVDNLDVNQTAFGTDPAVLAKRSALLAAAKTASDAALVAALDANIDGIDADLATAYGTYNADQKTYVADYIETHRPSSNLTPTQALAELKTILSVPVGHLATIVGLQGKIDVEVMTFLTSADATALLTPASLAAYNGLTTNSGKQKAVQALLEGAANFKVPADVSAALVTAVAVGEAFEERIETLGGPVVTAATTLSGAELVAALDTGIEVVNPVLAASYNTYEDDQKTYVADYIEANRPTAAGTTVENLDELSALLAVPIGEIDTIVDLQNKTETEMQAFLASGEATALLTPASLAAYNGLIVIEKAKAAAAMITAAADFKLPADASAALLLAAEAAAQPDPNETYGIPVPSFGLEDGAKNLHPDQPLHITFTPGIDAGSLTGFTLASEAGTPVAFTAYASYDGTDIVVKPNSSLAANTTYTLTVPEGVINSAATSSIKAKSGSVTFSTGANDGTYQEENFNTYTYGSTTAWDIINGLKTSFGTNSSGTINGTAITGQAAYESAAAQGVFDNGNGPNLLANGALNLVQVAATGANTDSTYVLDFANVTAGRLQIGFDLSWANNPTLTNNDSFIRVTTPLGTDYANLYYKYTHNNEETLNVASNVETYFGDTSMTWTHADGTPASIGESRFTAGHYKFLLDIDVTNGTADVSIVKTKPDGTKIYGNRATTPRTSTVQPFDKLVFTTQCMNEWINTGNNALYDQYSEILGGGLKQYAYSLDNIFVRSFSTNPTPAINYSGPTNDVALTHTPVLNFTTPVTEAAATSAITITDKRGNNVAFTGSMDATGKNYTITPTGGLAYNNSTYTITFAGCKDWSGKEIAEATYTFATIPDAGYDSRKAAIMEAAKVGSTKTFAELKAAIDAAIGDVNDEASVSYSSYSEDQKTYVANYVVANRPVDGDFAGLGTTIGTVVDALDAVEALSTADRAGMSALLATSEKRTEMLLSAEAANAYAALNDTQKDNTITALTPLVANVVTPEDASAVLLNAIATATAPLPTITPSIDYTGVVSNNVGSWGGVNLQVSDGDLANNTNTNLPEGNSAFGDLGTAAWAQNAINILASHGIISGRGDGNFYPNDSITREEFLKMALQALEVTTMQEGVLPFKDVPVDSWYYPVISQAYETGIVGGVSSDTFGVGASITRQDMALILHRILKQKYIELSATVEIAPFIDHDSFGSEEAKEAVETLAKGGIINGRGDGSFDPLGTATRAEAATVIYRVLYRLGLL